MVAESRKSLLERQEKIIDETLVDAIQVNSALREIRERLGKRWPEWCLYKFGKSSEEIESMMELVNLCDGEQPCRIENN